MLVVAELLAAQEGLAFRVVRAQRFRQVDTMFALLIVFAAIGLVATWPCGRCATAPRRGRREADDRIIVGAVTKSFRVGRGVDPLVALDGVDMHVDAGELVSSSASRDAGRPRC